MHAPLNHLTKKTGRFILLILFLFNSALYAQSSDQVKYYIAYDKSGSVAYLDRNNNLQEMLKELLNVNNAKGKINTFSDFDIFFFGDEKKQSIRYNKATSVVIDSLLKKTDKSKKEKFTHIHDALNEILAAINSEKGNISTGVIIITDGLIDSGDIDITDTVLKNRGINSLSKYLSYRNTLIKEIQNKTNNKLYFIQTSPRQSQFFTLSESITAIDKNVKIDSSYIKSDNFFWLNTNRKLSDSSNKYLGIYRDFIHDINASIIAPHYITPTDSISTIILIQEIVNLQKLLGKTTGTEKLNFLSLLSATQKDNKQQESIPNKQKSKNDGDAKSDTSNIQEGSNIISANRIAEIQKTIYSLTNDKQNINELLELKNSLIKSLNESEKASEQTTQLLLTEAYKPAELTPVTKIAESKGFENIQQTAILGATDYVIERAKQEALYAFFDVINKEVFNDSATKIKIIFPNISDLLKNKITYPDLSIIQAAVKEDMRKLPENLMKMRKDFRSEGLFSLYLFFQLYDHITTSGSLEKSFTKLNKDIKELMPKLDANNCSPVYALESMYFTSSLIGYLNKYDLEALYNTETNLDELSRLLVVLSLDYSRISCVNIDSAASYTKVAYNEYRLIKGQMAELKKLTEYKPTADFEGYRKYQKEILLDILQRTANLLTAGSGILNHINFKCDTSPCNINNMYAPERVQQVATTIRHIDQAIESWFLLKNQDYARAAYLLAPDILSLLGSQDKAQQYQRMFINVAGEIASAKRPEDVKNIIAKYALPVASYKTKRHSMASLMLSAYPGIGGSLYKGENKPNPTIFCPIGPEFTFHPAKHRAFSISVMVSAFDIGNVINYRLLSYGNDTTGIVSFERILSPGINLSFGFFKNLPLSLNIGYLTNPSRFNAGVALDMPLLGVWKSKSVIRTDKTK